MRHATLIFIIFIFSFSLFGQQKSGYPRKFYFAKLKLTDGTDRSGIWMDCNDTTIIIGNRHDTASLVTISIEHIYQLEIRKANSIKRNTLIGAGLGFAIGFGVGWYEYEPTPAPYPSKDETQLGHAAGSGLLGGFIGGFLGFISGTFGKSYSIFGNPDLYQRFKPELMRYKPTAK